MIRRILSLPAGRFACGFLAFVLVLAVAGPALAPYDPIGELSCSSFSYVLLSSSASG